MVVLEILLRFDLQEYSTVGYHRWQKSWGSYHMNSLTRHQRALSFTRSISEARKFDTKIQVVSFVIMQMSHRNIETPPQECTCIYFTCDVARCPHDGHFKSRWIRNLFGKVDFAVNNICSICQNSEEPKDIRYKNIAKKFEKNNVEKHFLRNTSVCASRLALNSTLTIC